MIRGKQMGIPVHVQDRLAQLKDSIKKLISQAKTGSLDATEMEEYLLYIKAIKREYRVLRGEYDLLYFAYEYFADQYNSENENNLIPEGQSLSTAPDFHRELCNILDSLNVNIKQKIAWSVPRGHAKSAYLSNILPLHQIVYNKRHYIIIVSETESMSRKFVSWICDQLKFNKKVIEDFGVLLNVNKMANESDNQEGFETSNKVKVQSASIGKQLRGARFGAYRPDLIILDDLESSKNTNTKELRDKNLHWFNSVIMPIGDITRSAFVYMGTLVNGNGLLPNVVSRSDFHGKIYSAVIGTPDHQEYWDEFDRILRDQENEDREHDAEVYYFANKEIMDMGTETLWNDRFPYYELMKIKVNVGSRAFGSEYLNTAIDDESAIFKSSLFQYYDDKDLFYPDGRAMNLEIFGFWDLAIGKNDRSDYNAIVTIGRDRRTGIIYILDAWAKKCPLHIAMEVCIEKIQEYGHTKFGIEAVQAQFDSFRQVRDRLIKMGIYRTRVLPILPKGRKEDRIEELEPLIEQGVIRFKKNQRLMLEMMEQFPSADNDDLPDSLASVVNIAGKQRKRTFYKKPEGF
jgi:predicted phage terminase large subunit-like protein